MTTTDRLAKALSSSEDVLAFRDVAIRYCTFIESRSQFTKQQFLRQCRLLLSELYLRAVHLPVFEPTSENVWAREMEHEAWDSLFLSLIELLGETGSYAEVYDPIHPSESEPTQQHLADDLADIYRDLKEGIICWDSDSPERYELAVWQWKFNFEDHWGRHLTGALKAIHWLAEDPLK